MKNIAMLFPGQGSQYAGMGQKLFTQHESVRQLFKTASTVLGMDMEKLCFEGPAEQLNDTRNTQPALVLCSVAAYRVFEEQTGLRPVVLAGHSIGEISALICSGALGFEDGLKLARARGEAMAACSKPGETGMAAVVKLDRARVEAICQTISGFGETFVIANYNSAAQLVLSGAMDALALTEVALKEQGANYIPLRVSGAFHSPFMKPAAETFRNLVKAVHWQQPRIPVIANINAQPYTADSDIAESLVDQISQPVLWQDSLEQLAAGTFTDIKLAGDKIDLFIETGPGVVLKKLTTVLIDDALAFSLDHAEDEEKLQQQLEVDIRNIKHRPAFLGKCMAVAVATRNSNFDDESYRTHVVAPYQKLREMHEACVAETRQPSLDEMKQGLTILTQIMTAKQASADEQRQRFREILRVTRTEDLLPEFAG